MVFSARHSPRVVCAIAPQTRKANGMGFASMGFLNELREFVASAVEWYYEFLRGGMGDVGSE